ncbi:unnamed protein product [Adineta ricciae]|uniref:Uncharacterized protein n=1 Tax=Adineta ricciae TaxID=249248 RepID=A0A815YAJ4_ADIRI|nr:unnamed protein product [Adineta ricciae]CAF1569029.1 unnamed protein product [Adineta ricciae]
MTDIYVDQWATKNNYTSYFDQCAPSLCTYSTTDPLNFSYIISLLLSLYGGLTAIFRLIAPLLINIALKLKRQLIKSMMKCELYFKSIRHSISWIRQLNLFKLATNRTMDEIKEQRIITRCYLVLFAISVSILIVFTTINAKTNTVTVSNPSLNTYKELQNSYSSTLKCACSESAMHYETFVSLSPIFHQVCPSDLVSDPWISWLVESLSISMNDNVWLYTSGSYFEQLAALCQLANTTANDDIRAFLARTLATSHVLNTDDFNTQLNTTINQLIESTVINFGLFINMTRLFMQVDQPLTFSFRLNAIQQSFSSDRVCQCAHDMHCQGETDFIPDDLNSLVEYSDSSSPENSSGYTMLDLTSSENSSDDTTSDFSSPENVSDYTTPASGSAESSIGHTTPAPNSSGSRNKYTTSDFSSPEDISDYTTPDFGSAESSIGHTMSAPNSSGNSNKYTTSDFGAPVSSSKYSAPGIVKGCYIIDSVLLSTLECFYADSK